MSRRGLYTKESLCLKKILKSCLSNELSRDYLRMGTLKYKSKGFWRWIYNNYQKKNPDFGLAVMHMNEAVGKTNQLIDLDTDIARQNHLDMMIWYDRARNIINDI